MKSTRSMLRIRRLMAVVAWAGFIPTGLIAQHAFTPDEIAEGARMFQSTCTTCHGNDGAAIPGVPLVTGTFRDGASDDVAIAMIRDGIPGTGMPGFANISEEDAGKIVAFLRTGGNVAVAGGGSGDALRGEQLFETSGCMNCHRVNGQGGRLGPDLSRIGAPPVFAGGFGAEPPPSTSLEERLELALVDPGAEVAAANRTFEVVMNDGSTLTGRLMSHDTFTLSLLDPTGNRLVTFQKADLETYQMVDSPMPSYRERMDSGELADVISYLLTLRGPDRR